MYFRFSLNLKAQICDNPYVFGPMFVAAHMGVEWELKFSPTWKVGGELHYLIRWSVAPLCK